MTKRHALRFLSRTPLGDSQSGATTQWMVVSVPLLQGSSQCVTDIRLRHSTFSSFRSHVFSLSSGRTRIWLHLQVAEEQIALFLRHDWRKIIASESGRLTVENYSCQKVANAILDRSEKVSGRGTGNMWSIGPLEVRQSTKTGQGNLHRIKRYYYTHVCFLFSS